jgi:thrombospondin type 3 repeat protein
MTNLKRILILGAALGLSTTLLATMDMQKKFGEKYPDAKAKLGKCSTCHVKAMPKKGEADLNTYGKDLGKALDFAGAEAKDSDGDGVKNADEIKAGTNPGDPASK